MPSHYLNQCSIIVNWTLANIFQWKFNQNTAIFIEENARENVVCELASILSRTFISEWENEINDINIFPSLRTYRIFKTKYQLEPYLYLVKNPKYRMAISKFGSSSHILEIERARHTRPITPLENRLCPSCKVVETEIHFLLKCPIYECYRKELFSKILSVDSYVKEMLPINKFIYLMTSSDAQILKWVGKFVHLSFIKRVNIMKVHTIH